MNIFNRKIVGSTKNRLQTDIAKHATAITELSDTIARLQAEMREHSEVHQALSDALMSLEFAEGL